MKGKSQCQSSTVGTGVNKLYLRANISLSKLLYTCSQWCIGTGAIRCEAPVDYFCSYVTGAIAPVDDEALQNFFTTLKRFLASNQFLFILNMHSQS
jgi:hypothetical protein